MAKAIVILFNIIKVDNIKLFTLNETILLLIDLIISEIRKKNKKCVGASLPYSLYLFIL